jgi:CxxC motif-containing protein (DUF1111 family)
MLRHRYASFNVIAITTTAVLLASCQIQNSDDSPTDQYPVISDQDIIEIPTEIGGDNSVENTTSNAFSLPSAAMPLSQRLDFSVGNSFFRNAWVTAPASTTARDGLGPFFNTNACQSCHIKDGRGHLPANAEDNNVSMLVRLSIGPSQNPEFSVANHPVYGEQLQDAAIPGIEPEAELYFEYEYHTEYLTDGTAVELQKPIPIISTTVYDALGDNLETSVRLAPPMIGLGYLQAITEQQILNNVDPNDEDNNGISGRVNRVWDKELKATTLGRFGWKAGQPNLKQQNASAFSGDMGLTSTIVASDDCTSAQTHCLNAVDGGTPEVSDNILDKVTFYTANLAVPKRRNSDDPSVINGSKHFQQIGCSQCHQPKWEIGDVDGMPWLSNQTIYPFSDLLLHDMGEGLADHRTEFEANGKEWRTPPLWGIGLTENVNNEFGFLHDGRARTLTEAIVWHGGEAQASKNRFSHLTEQQRAELIAFLKSL